MLSVADIAHPLGQIGGTVHLVDAGAHIDLHIAGPAEAFVALWTVCRDRQEVATLAPADILPELVEQLLGALEFAGQRGIDVHHAAIDVVGMGCFVEPGDFDETKTFVGKRGFDPPFCAVEDEGIGLLRSPQIDSVE